VMAGFKA